MHPNAATRLAGHVVVTLVLVLAAGLPMGRPALAQTPNGSAGAAPADPALLARVAQDPTWGPALAYRTPATAAAERALREARAAASRSRTGWGAALTLSPSVAWRGRSNAPATPPRWRTDVGGEVSVRYDRAVVARAALDLHRAEVALQLRAFRDLREALSLHIDLQRAHAARTLAEATASDRDATRADAEATARTGDAADAVPITLAAARLEAERADADVERAGRTLAEAERRAAAAGFDVALAAALHRDRTQPLPLEGWRLALPDVPADATPDVVTAVWARERATAELARAELGGVLEDLWVDTALTLPDVRLRASFDVDEGRPGAAVDARWRAASGTSWSVTVGASLRLDDDTLAAIGRARADTQEAADAVALARAEAPRLLAAARQAALDAEADVAFAERALVIGRAGLAEAVSRWRTATAAGDAVAGSGEAADTARAAARARADEALRRTAIGFERERDAFHRAWNAYLLQVERYLAVAGSSGGVLAPP